MRLVNRILYLTIIISIVALFYIELTTNSNNNKKYHFSVNDLVTIITMIGTIAAAVVYYLTLTEVKKQTANQHQVNILNYFNSRIDSLVKEGNKKIKHLRFEHPVSHENKKAKVTSLKFLEWYNNTSIKITTDSWYEENMQNFVKKHEFNFFDINKVEVFNCIRQIHHFAIHLERYYAKIDDLLQEVSDIGNISTDTISNTTKMLIINSIRAKLLGEFYHYHNDFVEVLDSPGPFNPFVPTHTKTSPSKVVFSLISAFPIRKSIVLKVDEIEGSIRVMNPSERTEKPKPITNTD